MYNDYIDIIYEEIYKLKYIVRNTELNNFVRISYSNNRPDPNSYTNNQQMWTFVDINLESMESTKFGLIGTQLCVYMKNMIINAEKYFVDIRDKLDSESLIKQKLINFKPKNIFMSHFIDYEINYGIGHGDVNTIVNYRVDDLDKNIIFMFDHIELNIGKLDFYETPSCYKAVSYQDFKVINPKILYIINDSESDNYKLYKQFLRDEKLNKLCI